MAIGNPFGFGGTVTAGIVAARGRNLSGSYDDYIQTDALISINVKTNKKHVIIDFCDNGKGILKYNFKNIFEPGYTSKKRGWGLGLSLSKRIILEYHSGKIFVLKSIPYKQTVIRIILNK